MKVTVTPVITGPQSFKIVTEFVPDPGDINPYVRELSTKVVDLEDQACRAALIKLGWTPPAK